jgi:hypothetical protein
LRTAHGQASKGSERDGILKEEGQFLIGQLSGLLQYGTPQNGLDRQAFTPDADQRPITEIRLDPDQHDWMDVEQVGHGFELDGDVVFKDRIE